MKFIKVILIILFSSTSLSHGIAQNKDLNKTFVFGKNTNKNPGIAISTPIKYTDNLGYGFDCQSAKNIHFNETSIGSDVSIYFSAKVPEGNYRVTVTLTGKTPTKTTIKAESRRLMVRDVEVAPNTSTQITFVVNVRTPNIDDHLKINIKDREIHYLNWDDRLTLEFHGNSNIKAIEISSIPRIRTLFLAGDSTVTDQDLEPWASWGQFITQYFTDSISIANYAASGASLSSFKARHRLEKILDLMQPNDCIFIEFGHNDEKRHGEGIGPWHSYSNLLREFITRARSKGGIPVLITPTQRRFFKANGSLEPTHGDYPDAMRQVARDLKVPLIDLTKMTTKMYEAWGDEISRKAFVQYPANTFPGQTVELKDNTHFNSFGANEIAKCIVQRIKDLNLDISKNLKTGIAIYKPEKPDSYKNWNLPMSPRFENTKPDGN